MGYKVSPEVMRDYYILEFKPDHPRAVGEGWVPQHILVMEDFLGRSLSDGEEVKHKNGNPHDNSIANLVVTTPQFGGTHTVFESQFISKEVAKSFVPCRYQKECWKTIRVPKIRAAKAQKISIYLPYNCSFQTEGDIYSCSHYWNFLKRDQRVPEKEIEE